MDLIAGLSGGTLVRLHGSSPQPRARGTELAPAQPSLISPSTFWKAEAAMSWTLPVNDRSRRLSERLGYELIEPASSLAQEGKYRLLADNGHIVVRPRSRAPRWTTST